MVAFPDTWKEESECWKPLRWVWIQILYVVRHSLGVAGIAPKLEVDKISATWGPGIETVETDNLELVVTVLETNEWTILYSAVPEDTAKCLSTPPKREFNKCLMPPCGSDDFERLETNIVNSKASLKDRTVRLLPVQTLYRVNFSMQCSIVGTWPQIQFDNSLVFWIMTCLGENTSISCCERNGTLSFVR